MRFIDLTGQKFGRLTVRSLIRRGKGKRPLWKCECECGGSVSVRAHALKSGNTGSCGCLHSDLLRERLTSHGKTGTPLYVTWYGIKTRVSNPKQKSYKNYGGRGICMHKAWFDDFTVFESYVLRNLGERPEGKTLDRIDNERGYEPGNLRWATSREQAGNTRATVRYTDGQDSLRPCEWAERLGIGKSELYRRLKNGKLDLKRV